jgi:hypothetical protein
MPAEAIIACFSKQELHSINYHNREIICDSGAIALTITGV